MPTMDTKNSRTQSRTQSEKGDDMNTKPRPEFRWTKQNEQLRQRIDGHIDQTVFAAGVNRARAFLGSTTIFGSSYKIDLSNALNAADLALLANKEPYLTMVSYMPPSDSSGRWNFCPWATDGCRAVCLGIGSGRMNHGAETLASREFDMDKTVVTRAMMKRAELFMADRQAFTCQMIVEIHSHLGTANRKGIKAAVRPNGTTDVPWESVTPEIFAIFGSEIQFYDYTKAPLKVRRNAPANYHLTFSRAETLENQRTAAEWIAAGHNAAVVFSTDKYHLPETFEGMPVLNGDLHDMRFKDAPGHWVGLSAKGAAKKDTSGFVVQV
jgi:hypothetical protein